MSLLDLWEHSASSFAGALEHRGSLFEASRQAAPEPALGKVPDVPSLCSNFRAQRLTPRQGWGLLHPALVPAFRLARA